MVRIAAINYLNTIPFVYGLERMMAPEDIDMHFCTPSESAAMLLDGRADVGIIPAAVIPQLADGHIVSDWCIGSTSKVASVLVCSGVPIREAGEILLDIDSRTSVLLTRWLCRERWHIAPRLVPCDFSDEAPDPRTTCLLIGDKALRQSARFPYVYDLAEEWIAQKHLPFVFACWTANKRLDPQFIEKFNNALGYGVSHIAEAVEKYDNQFPRDFACRYLQENISFALDSEKRAGLTEFWRVALEKLTPRDPVS
ncbi:MAG: menaquinone biosynthesis protein [Bacteroidales bacterium]|nr:menaquinone biosynthesis protein [Bacteroidales bacterium]